MSVAGGNKAQLFENAQQADSYKKYRPTYPKELYECIYHYAGSSPTDKALDVATGKQSVPATS